MKTIYLILSDLSLALRSHNFIASSVAFFVCAQCPISAAPSIKSVIYVMFTRILSLTNLLRVWPFGWC